MQAEQILATYEARPEIILRELNDAFAAQGERTTTSDLSRFSPRDGITWIIGLSTQLSRRAAT